MYKYFFFNFLVKQIKKKKKKKKKKFKKYIIELIKLYTNNISSVLIFVINLRQFWLQQQIIE